MMPGRVDVAAGVAFAADLFEAIGAATFDGIGFTRASYGEGEQRAHDMVADAALGLGLVIERDAALNLSMTLRGAEPDRPALLIGSHLDAVPQGGNFDGLAGVLAGLACAHALRQAGIQPRGDIRILGIRAEESAWFGAQHIGSRAMLGMLTPEILEQACRSDTGLSLAQHMQDAGADMAALVRGEQLIHRPSVGAYIELHIEQGPVLVGQDLPVGIVTGIRGNRRCRRIICSGAYGHSGTVPRAMRQDAVIASSDLILAMDNLWREIEREGGDLVLTFGQLFTDASSHAVTTVPGKTTFSFDARSHSAETLARVERDLLDQAQRIERDRNVHFAFDPLTGDAPAAMDAHLQDRLLAGAELLGIPAMPIASGAGHDAGDFAEAGIPSAMIFIRNDNGSHNPEEAMDMADFARGVELLSWFVADHDGCDL